MRTYVILFLCCINAGIPDAVLFSQNDTAGSLRDTTDLRRSFYEELLFEDPDQSDEDSALQDLLENLKSDPYDLNKVSATQLENIPFLNSITARKIIDYRNKNGPFRSKRALLNIVGITDELYERIKIYLVVRQSKKDLIIDETGKEFKPVKLRIKPALTGILRSRMLQDLQPKRGFLTNEYEGSGIKIYNRLDLKYSKPGFRLEANITVEKDAGEKNLTDFTSGFLKLSDAGPVKKIIAGDYTLNFAQGLAMWSLQAFSKGIEAVNPVKKKGKGTDGYGSVNEVQFFRGGSAEFVLNNFNLNIFYSDNYYDAASNITKENISSFYYDGYHRTSNEMQRQNSVKEKLIGGRVEYEKGSLKLGATYWTSAFSKPVIPDSARKLYKFSGTKAGMTGFDYDLIIRNMNFFGEFALSRSGSLAGINAVQFTFFKIADLIFSYRNYPEDLAPVHSFGFSEKGETYNERGFYSGIAIRAVKGLIINGYYDQYKFPYRTYFNPVPVSGTDFLANIEWKVLKGLIFNLKYKNENKEDVRSITDEEGRSVKRIDKRDQLNVRTGFIYQASGSFRFRSRFEFVNIDYDKFGGDNKGFLFYSDVRVIPVPGFVFDARIIFFNTDSYDSRIYEFENDIQGVMSNLPLYGKGQRWYLLFKYKPFLNVSVSAKYAETFLSGVKSIGSGNDKINGDINNRFSAGVEINY